MTETTETIPGPVAEPRRLSRARDGRWLGGVSAGLGRYFNLSPMIYRVAFVALALAGGTGILLYVAAWLVIPDDGVEDSIAAEAIKGAAKVLNIAWVEDALSRPARIICPRSTHCPRTEHCDGARASRAREITDVREEIISKAKRGH